MSAKKIFKVGHEIDCVITEINKAKRRVAISHRLTKENPFETFEKKSPVGELVEGEIINKNEYSLFVKIGTLDIDTFLHCNDLSYSNNSEDELKKFKKGDNIKVKVLEIKQNEQKIHIFLGGPMGPIHPVWGHVLVSFFFSVMLQLPASWLKL